MGLALSVALGCQKSRQDSPVAAYQSFTAALAAGELANAYGALSAPTKAAIGLRTKAVVAAADGGIKDHVDLPALMTFSGTVKPAQPTEVKVLSQTATEAMLEVTAGGASTTQRMLKEGDRWSVDLAQTFEQTQTDKPEDPKPEQPKP